GKIPSPPFQQHNARGGGYQERRSCSSCPWHPGFGGVTRAYAWQSRWPSERRSRSSPAAVQSAGNIHHGRYSIFSRLSSVGKTDLDLITLRNWRLKPSMALVI